MAEAQSEVWDIRYRWSYGERGRAWLAALSEGRLIGYRARPGGRVFIPPEAPVEAAGGDLEIVSIGPHGTVEMADVVPPPAGSLESHIVARIRLDGAAVRLFAPIEFSPPFSPRRLQRVKPGARVSFVPPSAPLRSVADIRFRLLVDG
ncbi:MAG: hypothetical protein AB7I79_03915 [Rhizobiaceae bacterium]